MNKEIEKAKEDLSFFNEGDYITKEMSDSARVLEEYIKELEQKESVLNKVTDILEENILKAKEQVKYWEKEYQVVYMKKDEFYKNSYKRQINMWQSRRETLQEILNIIKGGE